MTMVEEMRIRGQIRQLIYWAEELGVPVERRAREIEERVWAEAALGDAEDDTPAIKVEVRALIDAMLAIR